MAHRHKLSKGGRANPFKHNYTAPGSSREESEAERGDAGFRRGGHHAGKAHGGKAKHRADRRARGGSVFSAAGSKLRGEKAFASPPHHGEGHHGAHFDKAAQKGSSRKGHAGKAEHQYAAGGGVAAPAKKGGAIGKKGGGPIAKNRGGPAGECEPAGKEGAGKEDGGEEEEDGRKRGGKIKRKAEGGSAKDTAEDTYSQPPRLLLPDPGAPPTRGHELPESQGRGIDPESFPEAGTRRWMEGDAEKRGGRAHGKMHYVGGGRRSSRKH